MSQKIKEKSITFEKFLKKYDGQSCEWVNGKVISLSPVHLAHDQLCGWLRTLLFWYIQQEKSGRTFSSQFAFKLGYNLPSRSPDIAFVRTASLSLD